jgi:hypothetical protein
MTSRPEPRPPDDRASDDPAFHRPERPDEIRLSRIQRRRKKIRDEIERNRRGEYTVPTWVLVLALVLLVAGWLALVLLS